MYISSPYLRPLQYLAILAVLAARLPPSRTSGNARRGGVTVSGIELRDEGFPTRSLSRSTSKIRPLFRRFLNIAPKIRLLPTYFRVHENIQPYVRVRVHVRVRVRVQRNVIIVHISYHIIE